MMAKIEIDTKVVIKVGFYLVWIMVWVMAALVGHDESLRTVDCGAVFMFGMMTALGIQILFSGLKWLIFDWNQTKGNEEL
jgi:hypothetical protein